MNADTTTTTRRHDLDWLRVLAFAILILYHVGMFYVTWDWHVKSDHSSAFLEQFMSLVNPWRLTLLFFISGVALRFMLDSRGSRAVVPERIKRLLLPIGFGMFVVLMPQAYFELRAKGEIEPGMLGFFGDYVWPFTSFSVITPTWNHLWFLVYILVYSLLFAVGYGVLTRIRTRLGPAMSAALERVPWLVLVLPALPAVFYALTLVPAFPETHMLINDWALHALALTVMLIGWCVAKSAVFWAAVRTCLLPAAVLAVGLGVLLAATGGPEQDGVGMLAVAEEFYAWVVIVAVLGVGQRFLDRPSRALICSFVCQGGRVKREHLLAGRCSRFGVRGVRRGCRVSVRRVVSLICAGWLPHDTAFDGRRGAGLRSSVAPRGCSQR